MHTATAALLALSSLAILAVATPTPNASLACNTSPVQCCNQVLPAGSPAVAPLLDAVGVVVQDLNLPIGIACAPITGVGVGTGSACSEVTVCCEDNSHGTLISIGCLPVIL
ncbi:fungal hydrophobin [Trametes cingulata]|nr:fungal hydrophobin [Trametes cingulata]